MEGLKILVVDDEARMRKLVRDFLSIKGFSVVEAADGEEALDRFFEQKDIALVLLDVMMPKLDGWEVLKTIRKYSQIPVLMLTARGEESDELQGFRLGVDEYISKPFSPKILVARVEAILRRSSAVSQDILRAGGHRDRQDGSSGHGGRRARGSELQGVRAHDIFCGEPGNRIIQGEDSQ